MILPFFPIQAPALDLAPMPSGVFDRVHGYAPFGLKLSGAAPASLKKAPEAMHPTYGTIKLGIHEFLAMLDGTKLYVDSNADGDLTDDPAATWAEKTFANGTKSWEGSATVELPYDGKIVPCRIGLYSMGQPNEMGYYADFALSGKISLGGKAYDALYSDPTAAWDGKSGVLMIDKDGDGKFHPGYEFYRANEPFNVGGKTYEMRGLAIVPSTKTVAERTLANSAPVDPNLKNGLVAGKAVLPFRASVMNGKKLAFPGAYRGKVVLLDFWATWCGPCMREVPNVVKAYQTYHANGFEVLGVSLDKEKAQAQIKAVTTKQGMVWDQVYDGRYFDARIAKQYGIVAIPATYLVDGDTGRILAAGDGARGEKLGFAIERALRAKGRAKPSAIL